MTYPRHLLVPPGASGTYHCMSRCVRRAYLCGKDHYSGRSFEHRKRWVEDRLLALGKLFAIDIYAFAVMSNHLHIVVHIEPARTKTWSDKQIATRWLKVFGYNSNRRSDWKARIAALCMNTERINEIRRRLSNLSWFMRCLKEPIARRANQEDDCTGRFWEGRFKVQAILDSVALLSCMAYVDLNPLRLGKRNRPINSPHTSAHIRSHRNPNRRLKPIVGAVGSQLLDISEQCYASLLEASANWITRDSRRNRNHSARKVLARMRVSPASWVNQMLGVESAYYRVIGNAQVITEKAATMAQQWLRGITFARAIDRLCKGQQSHF